MCLFSTEMINKKYTKTEKNGGVIPIMVDQRVKFVEVKCGRCIECKKQYARNWQVRLMEEIRHSKNGKFITLTFSDEELAKIDQEIDKSIQGYTRDNRTATIAVRRFLERWRKEHKKSVKHWLITELGHNGTKNVHIHGIIWTDHIKDIKDKWKYGYVYPRSAEEIRRNYVNEATVNYITKYITKVDEENKYYKGKVLTSPGIGANYINRIDSKTNTFQESNRNKTNETYKTRTGHTIGLPPYLRNKLYNDDQREILWREKLDKGIKWIRGEKINIKNNPKAYDEALKYHRRINDEMGYGTDKINGEELEKEHKRRKEMRIIRINKGRAK